MNRLLQPFVLAVTAILVLPYAYLAWRLGSGPWQRVALAVPFVLVWIVPVAYWGGRRGKEGFIDRAVHQASYLCMAWISFLLVLSLARDLLLATAFDVGVPLVLAGSLAALALGAAAALRGPHVKRVDIAVAGLHPDLEGYRIVQISDLHVSHTIGARYVGRAFFVLGNHDCYAGADAWVAKFRGMGMRVLLNEPALVEKGGAHLLVGGVVDPTFAAPRPELAARGGEAAHFRLLLAHNPRIAPLAVRLVHAPHVAGLSREGRMQVYVSAGTGTWGPPVRFGTSPELTLIRLVQG